MRAELITYGGEEVLSVTEIELPDNYNGEQYGDTVPFVVHSNQSIRIIENSVGHCKKLEGGE